ncbi:hypothetical protein ACFYXQ_06755 [Nocardia jiangxiensis]|uniref:Uncharacterized protein n=1 Tax=Nocardia jiangxiensis TaxID=282685 RepID=A0ABW6RTZ9_9NOCA
MGDEYADFVLAAAEAELGGQQQRFDEQPAMLRTELKRAPIPGSTQDPR